MSTTRILWLDLETTGLNPLTDHILEVGALITDGDLVEIARAEWTLGATAMMLAAMHPYVENMHRESGLAARCLEARLSAAEVDVACRSFCDNHDVNTKSFLAGNSVGDFDRHFMRRLLPLTNNAISHRSINVSTFKALYSIWDPVAAAPVLARPKAHRSILDCEAAIEELKYWLSLPVPAQFSKPLTTAVKKV